MKNRQLVHQLLELPMEHELVFASGPRLDQRDNIVSVDHLRDLKLIRVHGQYQTDLIRDWMSHTQHANYATAREYLERAHWNLILALNLFRGR